MTDDDGMAGIGARATFAGASRRVVGDPATAGFILVGLDEDGEVTGVVGHVGAVRNRARAIVTATRAQRKLLEEQSWAITAS